MKTKLFSKILGVGLAIGLVFALGAAVIPAGEAQANEMEWGTVTTPSETDFVIAPDTDIYDYAVGGEDGSIVYAIGQTWDSTLADYVPTAWYSDDGGVTWSDITDTVNGAADLPLDFDFFQYGGVAIAPDNEDWVAIAGVDVFGIPMVVASEDGGDNFSYTGDMFDSATNTAMDTIFDIAVSPEVDGIYNIAVAGISDEATEATGTVFRFEAGTWLGGSWVDTTNSNGLTTVYPGWDDSTATSPPVLWTEVVIAVDFSPNFDLDDTIVCMGVDYSSGPPLPYLQEGLWDSGGVWNGEASFPDAVKIKNVGNDLWFIGDTADLKGMGFALPADFDGTDPSANNVYLYVDAFDIVTLLYGGYVFIVENGALSGRCEPSGAPLLASIAVHGDADTCKAMIGTYAADFNQDTGDITAPDCCVGVPVYHTVELDDCCPEWEGACKDPSGFYMAMVAYSADGEKAFAATTGDMPAISDGGLCDESAFSVSLDNGVSFNQIGLIDTDIDFLSDYAICPDCETAYLSTVNLDEVDQVCWCDSVWRTWTKDGAIGDVWERVYHGDWTEYWDEGELLLRLPCDELTDCCTVYLGVQGTKNLYYTRDCGQCWNKAVNQKLDIQDVAVESENIVYILDEDGFVSASTQYGRRPSDGVDTEVGSGHSITSCCDAGLVLVGGAADEPVGYSDDGGETWSLTDDLDDTGTVHVACYDCSGTTTLFAATSLGGIYRTTIDSGAWDDIDALAYGYYGIVMARTGPDGIGALYAVSDNIQVDPTQTICNRFGIGVAAGFVDVYSGVARNLEACETDCCDSEVWDYLIAGMGTVGGAPGVLGTPTEWFDTEPSALRICGCTTMATNSVLWAIDNEWYDVTDGSDGTLWSYEDCAAKVGPVLTAPADETILPCEPCATCLGAPVTLKWERMCLACSYDIEIMDENDNSIISIIDLDIVGDPPTFWLNDARIRCGESYHWKVREANTETNECVHSPWSETWSFTIEVSSMDAVSLIAPEVGAMGVPLSDVGFSWTSVTGATSYSFVLSPNADLSGALATSDQSGTAYAYSGTLDYEVSYYWQVTAWKDGIMLSQSDIGTFSTSPEEIAPLPYPEPAAPPVINIPPTQQIVPTWIYAVIGIGAALIAVVIVLIVKSRGPKA